MAGKLNKKQKPIDQVIRDVRSSIDIEELRGQDSLVNVRDPSTGPIKLD